MHWTVPCPGCEAELTLVESQPEIVHERCEGCGRLLVVLWTDTALTITFSEWAGKASEESDRTDRAGKQASRRGRRAILSAMFPEHIPDLSTFSESDLFSLYRAILRELKSRGVIRSENAPVGDYAEYLVAIALDGELAPNSEKSWDMLGNDGEKLQVKARVVSDPTAPGQLQLSPFRSFSFDSAVIVLLSATDYTVSRASKVPRYPPGFSIAPLTDT
jgi:hypothetical protein